MKTFEDYTNQYIAAEEKAIQKAIDDNLADSTINAVDIERIQRVLTKHNVPIHVMKRINDKKVIIDMNLVQEPNLELEQIFDMLDGLDGIEAEIDGNVITLYRDLELI